MAFTTQLLPRSVTTTQLSTKHADLEIPVYLFECKTSLKRTVNRNANPRLFLCYAHFKCHFSLNKSQNSQNLAGQSLLSLCP